MKIRYGETAESRTMIISPLEAQLFMDAINFYPEGGRKVFAEFAETLRREAAHLVFYPSDELAPRRPVIPLDKDNQTHAVDIIYDFADGHIDNGGDDALTNGDSVGGQEVRLVMVGRFRQLRFIIDKASSEFDNAQSNVSDFSRGIQGPGNKSEQHLTPVPDL